MMAAQRKRWAWAAGFGSLVALTRLQGVLMIIPLFFMWWRQTGKRGWTHATLLGFIPLSSLDFLFYTRLSLIGIYQNAWGTNLVEPWMNIWATIGKLSGAIH
jgi:Gpi18-like mannosyltransferase